MIDVPSTSAGQSVGGTATKSSSEDKAARRRAHDAERKRRRRAEDSQLREREAAERRQRRAAAPDSAALKRVSFLDDVLKNIPPSGGCTDCGNVSYRVPTIHPLFALGAHEGSVNHTRGFAAVANAADSQPPTLRAAKILALTALDLLSDAELLREAKREFAALKLPSEEELQTAL
ncbi:hypothetical protein HPB51_013159 [Rhipicephalus microplus]|uniref:Uncharacterized protein n=1 Tax=Rhipicephalus microplus TaxID=6941 RepID=A0A9J6E256_RHIMP|nr:hypothetical protein HPB51_013159 [Rhipicephalus microplus]